MVNADLIISFLGGFGLFLFGIHIMGAGLQKSTGTKMQNLLQVLTKNKFTGFLLGILVTAVIQSSSGTTVMVVGFVNAGIMSLSQSVGIIMGANVGTTVTAWIVSSAEWADYLNPTKYAPVLIFIGTSMLLFSKKDQVKTIGEALAGLGILFVGMSLMSDSVKPLRESELIVHAFTVLGQNPLLGILAGALATAVIQSSSASVSILQMLAMAGLIPWNAAIYIIMGQNIGTCITALLSSVGATKNAKSAAYVHLLFNVLGSGIFSIIAIIYFTFINTSFGLLTISPTEISIAHTIFNLANSLLLYPFSNSLVAIAQKMAKINKDAHEEDETQSFLEDRILETPGFAIESCIKEICRMGYLSLKNLKLANESLIDGDIEKIQDVITREKKIDNLQDEINNYMVKLSKTNITQEQSKMITSLFHTVIDLERIGDHSENIAELAQFKLDSKIDFSPNAITELAEIMELVNVCVSDSIEALANNSLELAADVFKKEEAVDLLESNLRESHINRLTTGDCVATSGVIFLDVISNLERVSDHALNIAEVVVINPIIKK